TCAPTTRVDTGPAVPGSAERRRIACPRAARARAQRGCGSTERARGGGCARRYGRSRRWIALRRVSVQTGRGLAPHPSLKRIRPAASDSEAPKLYSVYPAWQSVSRRLATRKLFGRSGHDDSRDTGSQLVATP